jgi:DNA-binding response OmpR family regulator
MKKILFVDDDVKTINPLYKDLVSLHLFDILWLLNAEEVMDVLRGSKFDAIILDIMMPTPEAWSLDEQRRTELGLSTGLILFEKIRLEFSKMPILIYTAKQNVSINNKYTFTLRKPELSSEIVERLNKMIENEN